MMDPTKDPSITQNLRQRMVKIRRDIHQHPELAWNEHRTRDVISAQLTELGVEHTSGVAGTGVVADLPGPSGVPIIALRADTDALAIEEGTGLPFSSKARGVMHACGHDGHTSMLLGAAALLTQRSLPAPVRLIWQPAEETVDGAQAMIEAGVLKDVGMIFGGHIDPSYPTGTLVVTPGAVNASTDRFKITVEGQDAHGARPHEAVDAIVVASAVVQNLQTIVSRVLNPAEPGVVTVGRFVAGAVHNAIAGTAVLEGTLRAHSAATRATLREKVERIATATAAMHNAQCTYELFPGAPPVLNDAEAFKYAHAAALGITGDDNVVELATANMGGEDFADYLAHVPGCYIRFGAAIPNRPLRSAHSASFDFNEAALGFGALWFAEVARCAGHALATDDTSNQNDRSLVTP